MTARPAYKGLDLWQQASPGFLRQIWNVVNNILLGKINAVLDVTLTANSATTVVTDPRLSAFSALYFGNTTANAGAASVTYYDTQGKGMVTLHHANNANTDRIVHMLIVG